MKSKSKRTFSQLHGTHEPGLILSPPVTATEKDDGYLSATEIAALKLDADDADWVISVGPQLGGRSVDHRGGAVGPWRRPSPTPRRERR
jgi:hypothetical protein